MLRIDFEKISYLKRKLLRPLNSFAFNSVLTKSKFHTTVGSNNFINFLCVVFNLKYTHLRELLYNSDICINIGNNEY